MARETKTPQARSVPADDCPIPHYLTDKSLAGGRLGLGHTGARDKAPAPPIGGRVHEIRKQQELTLDELARRCGVSKSMLSQIERGKVNPTYATLWSITQALDVEMSQLIEQAAAGTKSKGRIEHVRPYAVPTIRSPDGKCTTRIFSPIHAGLPMEWYEMELEPGGSIIAGAHGYGAWEHMTVLEGEVVQQVGEEFFEIKTGETIRYLAEQQHGVINRSTRTVRCLLVVIGLDELRRQYRSQLPRRYVGGDGQ
jgi:transcriptional regulator with XRE-family HTH domain